MVIGEQCCQITIEGKIVNKKYQLKCFINLATFSL
jgi:hypothetical protein